jgi:hypothetical protein
VAAQRSYTDNGYQGRNLDDMIVQPLQDRSGTMDYTPLRGSDTKKSANSSCVLRSRS